MNTVNDIELLANANLQDARFSEFMQAVQNIDWQGPSISIFAPQLRYSPSFLFTDIPFSNSHPVYSSFMGPTSPFADEHMTADIIACRTAVHSVYTYLAELMPAYVPVRAAIMGCVPIPGITEQDIKSIMYICPRVMHLYCKRICIPLITNASAETHVGSTTMHLSAGSVYEINSEAPQWDGNNGQTMKVHMYVDVIDPAVYDALPSTVKETFYDMGLSIPEFEPYVNALTLARESFAL
jgi:hypothetical protein